MGFGQHSRTGERLQHERAVGYREPAKTGGYPIPREQVKSGAMTKNDILAGVDMSYVEKTRKTGHNEVTRWLSDGTEICRLRETDIGVAYPDGTLKLYTGGWNTRTTRTHLMDFLSRHNRPCGVWGDKKAGGNVMGDWSGNGHGRVTFKTSVTLFTDGTWQADAAAGY